MLNKPELHATPAISSAVAGPEPAADNNKQRKTRPDLRPLVILRPYFLKHSAMLTGAFISLVLATMATLAVPLGVRPMVDEGFSAANSASINKYFIIMAAIGITLALASAARFYFVNWLGERVVTDLRRDVFAHLTRLSPAFYETTHSGELMSRLAADTTQIKAAIASSASQALRNLMMVVGAVSMMVWTSPKLSGLVVIAIPIIVLPLMGYGRAVRQLARTAQDSQADANAYAGENLAAVRTMQAFTHEPAAIERFTRAVEQAFDAARARMGARAGLTAIAITLVFTSIIGILWFGAHEVLAGRMTGGTLGQFVLYALFAAGSLGGLTEVWGEVQQTAGAAERLAELLATRPQITAPGVPEHLPQPVRGEVEFDKVRFAYPQRPETLALDDFSLKVTPGETVALVGPSGAGKTTVFTLLLRFYDPQSGVIRLDDIALTALRPDDLRRAVAYVPQEPVLFADTVLENIRYGAPDADVAAIEAAARAAQAHEFITAMPAGYQTRLGERGVTLSGGQKQRIAIARAILRDAPVLLLDEATSALDTESEYLVQTALEEVMTGRTTLVIAHRLATVKAVDRLIVMKAGRIVEQGTHDELMARGGVYAGLAARQFGTADETAAG